MVAAPPIVAADLEGTLTAGETWRGIGRHLAAHRRSRAYRVFVLSRLPSVGLARLKLIDQQAFRDRWVRDFARLLAGLDGAALQDLSEWVVEHELWPKRREPILQELQILASNGFQVVLASGTYLPVLEAFAARIGATAIGTSLEWRDRRLTGRLSGPVNTGEAKAQRLQYLAAGRRIAAAYGDSLADLPMLGLAERAIAVHPDPALAAIARDRSWRIVSA